MSSFPEGPITPPAQGFSVAFGRAWKLTVNGKVMLTSDDGNQAARMIFETYQPGYRAYWYCDIQIYNLDAPTENSLISYGDTVLLEGGYANNVNYGKIFEGRVFQATWTRENVTDFVLGLHCIMGLNSLVNNFTRAVHSRFTKQVDIVKNIAAQARKPIALDPETLTAQFSEQKLARTQVTHGSPEDDIEDIAVSEGMQIWTKDADEKLVMGHLSGTPGQTIIYSATTGILGTPQQIRGNNAGMLGAPVITQGGIEFKVLLDTRLEVRLPPVQVQIVNSSIRQMLYKVNQNPSILDQDGQYIVGGVRHVGDTRGTDWYTEVTAYTPNLLAALVEAKVAENG
jgi:hypothetical protein